MRLSETATDTRLEMKKTYNSTGRNLPSGTTPPTLINFLIRSMALLTMLASLSAGTAFAQTVNKRLYLKSGGTLNRVVPTGGTITSTVSLTKNSASYRGSTAVKTQPGGDQTSKSTLAYTIPVGSNRLLLVAIASNNAFSIQSVTYGSQPLSRWAQKSATGSDVELWYVVAPNTGTTDVVTVNWGLNNTMEAVIGVADFINVNQTNPLGIAGSSTGSTSPYQVITPSNLGDVVVDVFSQNRTGSAASYGSGQSTIFIEGTNNIKSGSGYLNGAAGSTTTSYNSSNGTWTMLGVAIKGTANDVSFNQSPSFCSNFTIGASSTITVSVSATVLSGSTGTLTSVPFIFRLKDATTSTPTTIFESTSAACSGLGAATATGTLTWTGTIGSTYTVTSGPLIAEFTNDYTSAGIKINYDATTAFSYMQVPTTTYINIGSLTVYDAAYSGGLATSNGGAGVPYYIRASVTDPFGSGDINTVTYTITGPSGSTVTPSTVSTTTCGRIKEGARPPTATGTHTITASASEGTEGTVTATASTTFNVLSVGVTVTKTIVTSAPYQNGTNVTYRIDILNSGTSTLTTIPLQDQFSTSCEQFASASVVPSSLSGGTLNWTNVAGAGLAAGATKSLTVTLKIIGHCDPAPNTATVSGARNYLGILASTSSSTVNLNVDYPPVAVNDQYCLQGLSTLTVLSNDTDPDVVGFLSANAGLYTVTTTSLPAKGSVSVNGSGQIVFDPAGGTAMGEDDLVTFTYRVTELAYGTLSSTATVTVRYSTSNNPPTAVADSYNTYTGMPLIMNVLSNDSDTDGTLQSPTISVQPVNGTVVVNADKTITYTPNTGFSGSDNFVYRVSDDGCPSTASATATVSINVISVQYVCTSAPSSLTISPSLPDATSFTWTLPSGVLVTSSHTGSNTNPTTTSPTITIDWSGVTAGTYSVCAVGNDDCGPGPQQCSNIYVSKPTLTLTQLAAMNR